MAVPSKGTIPKFEQFRITQKQPEFNPSELGQQLDDTLGDELTERIYYEDDISLREGSFQPGPVWSQYGDIFFDDVDYLQKETGIKIDIPTPEIFQNDPWEYSDWFADPITEEMIPHLDDLIEDENYVKAMDDYMIFFNWLESKEYNTDFIGDIYPDIFDHALYQEISGRKIGKVKEYIAFNIMHYGEHYKNPEELEALISMVLDYAVHWVPLKGGYPMFQAP